MRGYKTAQTLTSLALLVYYKSNTEVRGWILVSYKSDTEVRW